MSQNRSTAVMQRRARLERPDDAALCIPIDEVTYGHEL